MITNPDFEGEDPVVSAITRGNLSAQESYVVVDTAIHTELSNSKLGLLSQYRS